MQMEKVFVSIVLDKRRIKADGKFPVKLRVFTSTPRKQVLYPTIFDYTEKEFQSIWETAKPRNDLKEQRQELLALENKANNVVKKLSPFSFEQFEKHLFRKVGEGLKIHYHFKNQIEELLSRKQLGTANTYQLAEKSFVAFTDTNRKQKYKDLTFIDITKDWLKNYENFMTEQKGRSLTTVSMYVRTLRAIFNKAIDEKELEKDYYPFGKRKYQVPATNNVKKALNKDGLKALFQIVPNSPEQVKAKDFWFFSYACNGMNIKDIALLRYKDIQNEKIEFYRAKTRITSKGNLKPITVYLNDFSKSIIKKYGKESQNKEDFIFNVINESMTPEQRQVAIKNFTRFINQHLKKLCRLNGLSEDISTYSARHSFASNFVVGGATIVDVMESLGHSNIQTTQNYLRSFDSETKKELANSLMNFD